MYLQDPEATGFTSIAVSGGGEYRDSFIVIICLSMEHPNIPTNVMINGGQSYTPYEIPNKMPVLYDGETLSMKFDQPILKIELNGKNLESISSNSDIQVCRLTLKAPITTKVICFSCLLKCLRSLYGKQCGPRSDCSYRSSLFWVHTVCFYT